MIRAMTTNAFWQLIGSFPADPDGERPALIAALADQGEAGIVAFSESLARALYELDTRAHCEQPVRDVSEPVDGPVWPMSEDVFLYARCAVVAAGPETWRRVVDDPTAFAGRWPVADGELLLSVAPEAYERATGLDWDHETEVSAETGSNIHGWGGIEEVADGEPESHWLSGGAGSDVGVEVRPAYFWASHTLQRAVETDPAWSAWWAGAGIPELELHPFYTPVVVDPPRVRKGRRVVRVEESFAAGPRQEPTDHEVLSRCASDDVRSMLDRARVKLGLAPLPSLPRIPSVPEDTPDRHPQEFETGPEDLLAVLLAAGVPPEVANAMMAQDE
jgi:hypothetical protein